MAQKKKKNQNKKAPKQIKYSIGLDIDDKSVKFITIREQDSERTITRFSIKEIPPSEDKIAAASNIIKTIITEESIEPNSKIYACAYGLGPTIRRISIPIMPDSEIAEAVKWEVRNLIPFPIEGAIVDYYKIGKISEKGIEKYDILAAVVQSEILNQLLNICEQAELKLDGITAVPFALWSLVKQGIDFKEDEVIAIIDVGAEAASLNLFKNNILQFTRDITVAGDSITKAMTGMLVADDWQLNLSYEQAEEIKIKYGIPEKDTKEKTDDGIPLIHIYEMISPTLKRLQNEILRSFDYYKEQFKEEKVDKVFLTGGSSNLKNLDGHLSDALGIKVQALEPLKHIEIDDSLKSKRKILNDYLPRLSLSIGLALGHTEMINFLDILEPMRAKKFDIEGLLRKLKLPTKTLAIIGVAFLTLAIGFNIYLGARKSWLQKKLRDRQIVLTDIKALNERKIILADIAKKETQVRTILAQLTKKISKGILLTNLIYDNNKRRIWLTGSALYPGQVGSLIKTLEDSGHFKDVNLLEIKKREGYQQKSTTMFRVTLFLE